MQEHSKLEIRARAEVFRVWRQLGTLLWSFAPLGLHLRDFNAGWVFPSSFEGRVVGGAAWRGGVKKKAWQWGGWLVGWMCCEMWCLGVHNNHVVYALLLNLWHGGVASADVRTSLLYMDGWVVLGGGDVSDPYQMSG